MTGKRVRLRDILQAVRSVTSSTYTRVRTATKLNTNRRQYQTYSGLRVEHEMQKHLLIPLSSLHKSDNLLATISFVVLFPHLLSFSFFITPFPSSLIYTSLFHLSNSLYLDYGLQAPA
jgi:hypothetical protein